MTMAAVAPASSPEPEPELGPAERPFPAAPAFATLLPLASVSLPTCGVPAGPPPLSLPPFSPPPFSPLPVSPLPVFPRPLAVPVPEAPGRLVLSPPPLGGMGFHTHAEYVGDAHVARSGTASQVASVVALMPAAATHPALGAATGEQKVRFSGTRPAPQGWQARSSALLSSGSPSRRIAPGPHADNFAAQAVAFTVYCPLGHLRHLNPSAVPEHAPKR